MRNKDKNKIYWLFFSAIIIASLITPYLIQKAIILGNEGDDDDEESSLMMIPLTPTPSNESFPDDYFSFIHKVKFIQGENANANNLTELMYKDGKKFEIQGKSDIGGYYFNISFFYNITNFNYTNPSFIDFYDFYLYLQIDTSIYPSIIFLQGFNGTDWYNITEISSQKIDFNRYLINNTPEMRIVGFTLSQKIITIERFCLLLTHNERYPFALNMENIGVYGYNHSGSSQWVYNPNWWKEDSRSAKIYHQGRAIVPLPTVKTITTTAIITMQLNDPHYLAEYNIEDIKMKGYSYPYYFAGIPIQYYTNGYIWNYVDETWDYQKAIGGWGSQYFTFDWSSDLQSNPDYLDYYDPITNTWKFKIYSYFRVETRAMLGIVEINLDYYYSFFNWTSLYSYYSFPEIENIYTEPPSPLSTLEQFKIRTDVDSRISSISKVEYYIENKSDEWGEMSNIGGDTWEGRKINISDFPNGDYICWINATDGFGYNTLKWYQFTVSNALPSITFIEPDIEGKKITQLYNYNINVSIDDIEDNPYEDPQILIYQNNISNPFLDWQTMERYIFLNPNYWNYSIDPINMENGLYTIRIKTNDTREIIVFNETTINIVNNPPSIEILEPSISELISPYKQKIICNISNEEPINSVQWDIATQLNGFDWKPLSFNITTEFWEGNFSLLRYEYGDYFLVINATDDKYNTSLEIKPIQIHPLLIYNIRENDISYNSIGIIVYSNPTITTDIVGQFKLNHHPIVVERDFEIYIPLKYEDAYKYYINRGFSKYEPVGFFAEGIYTLWYIPTYQTSDTVYFSLDKPIIINSLIEEEDDGTLKMEFILRSKHAFSSITIQNQLSKFISDPENYEYTLQYLYAGDWEDFDEDDYDVEAEDFPSFSFVWESIGEGMEISFRFIAVPIEAEESAIGGGLLVGFVALALVELIAQIVLINRRRNRPEKWGWGKYILVSVGIGAGTFIAGFVAGLFLFG